MQSGRQTRKKTSNQDISSQSSKASKDKRVQQENQNSINLPVPSKENTSDKTKPSDTQEIIQMNEDVTTQNNNDPSKPSENTESMVIEEPVKPIFMKPREILYGDDASEEVKKQIEALFESAQVYVSKEDFNQAINIYNRIVQLNEKSAAAWITKGNCFAMLDDNAKALQSYQQAVNVTPDSQKDDQLLFGIGLLYQKIEDWKNAEISFRNALRFNPSPTIKGEILYHLGMVMKARSDHQEAIKMLTNSILLGSFSIERTIDILCNIGTSLEEINELNEAMQTYKYALNLDENNCRALQCLAWLYFQMDKINDAIELLNKANLLNEEDSCIYYMKGRCYLKLSHHTKAYECLNKSITKDQSNSTFWCSLGILFAELTQLKPSHECLSNALKFNSKSPENYFNMGCLFELNCQWNDAIQMYDKALELQPNFQLSQTRKQIVQTQMENKNNSLEVQFKHHKFSLSFMKDIDKEKFLFFSSQIGKNSSKTSIPQISNGSLPSNNEMKDFDSNNAAINMSTSTKITENSPQRQDQTQQPITNNSLPIPSLQAIIPQIPANILSGLGMSQISNMLFSPSGGTAKLSQNDLNNAFLSKQTAPLQSPLGSAQAGSLFQNWNPLQALKQSLGNTSNFGGRSLLGIQKTNSNTAMTPTSTTNITLPSTDQNKIEEVQPSSIEMSADKKASAITSPIILKHDPQVLTSNKEEGHKFKVHHDKNHKTGFKLTQKGGRGEKGIIPQKKVKLDKDNGIDDGSSEGVKKTEALVLRPSPLNK